MLDCGIHPGLTGMDALPFVDMIEADQVDPPANIFMSFRVVDPFVCETYGSGSINFTPVPVCS